ncbi:MAG: cytidylate kinase-like family protein [Syntrophorhabdaceae bacterium]|nr:cytidylate kinase-like family protein [Syntrophorhabdaceae bacterium]MDD4194954.1 cytidylate kinase-like family protein [Syntrophorhabdaceae bacterium]
MWENITADRCEKYIERYFGKKGKTGEPKPAITISRAEGAGGFTVSSELSRYLQEKTTAHEEWTVFDQMLVTKVLEVFGLKGVGQFMKEEHKGTVTDAFEEFIGLHPSTWSLVERTNATILRLAQIGNCILVGRGGNLVTKDMPNVFHVRLVGSFEKRVEQAMKAFNYDQKTAAKYVQKKDHGRKRYVKDNFDADIEDPLLYHIVINTDLVTYEEAARIIGSEVIFRHNLDAPAKPEIMTGHRAAVF